MPQTAEYRREWRRRNPDKMRAQNKRNYWKHRIQKLLKAKQQRESGYFKNYYLRNRDKILASNRSYYDRRKRAVFGKCPCCGRHEKLVRDHDHLTGKWRDRICGGCNLALGHVQDSTDRLRSLISYLEKHNARS